VFSFRQGSTNDDDGDDDNNNNNTSESANVKIHYRVNTGTSDMGTINSSDRIAAALYSLGTLFVSGIYV
jgi:hypothetical protein